MTSAIDATRAHDGPVTDEGTGDPVAGTVVGTTGGEERAVEPGSHAEQAHHGFLPDEAWTFGEGLADRAHHALDRLVGHGGHHGPSHVQADHVFVAAAQPRPTKGWLVHLYRQDPTTGERGELAGITSAHSVKRVEAAARSMVAELTGQDEVSVVVTPGLPESMVERIDAARLLQGRERRHVCKGIRRDLKQLGVSSRDANTLIKAVHSPSVAAAPAD